MAKSTKNKSVKWVRFSLDATVHAKAKSKASLAQKDLKDWLASAIAEVVK